MSELEPPRGQNKPWILGEVTVPSGTVVVVDAGLLGLDDVSPFSVEVEGVDPGTRLEVLGDRMNEGDHEDNWRSVQLVVRPGVKKAWSEPAGRAVVDYARLMFADKGALPSWKHEEPMDGKADFVWWGQDAKLLADALSAPVLPQGQFGWVDLPYDEAVEKGKAADDLAQKEGWLLRTDIRPHSHHYQLSDRIQSTPTQSGMVDVDGARFLGFHTTWGDGVFPVFRDMGADGKLMAVRIQLATEQANEMMDTVNQQRAIKEEEAVSTEARTTEDEPEPHSSASERPGGNTELAKKKATERKEVSERAKPGARKVAKRVKAAKKSKPTARPLMAGKKAALKPRKTAARIVGKKPGRKSKYSDKRKDAILERYYGFRKDGLPVQQAAKNVGVSYMALKSWEKSLGKKPPKLPRPLKMDAGKRGEAKAGRKPGKAARRKPGRPPSARGHLKKALAKKPRKQHPPAPRKAKGLVLVTPSGYLIEGISTKEIILVLKELR